MKKSCLPVFRNASDVLVHGGGRRHSVKEFEFLAIAFNDFASRLVMAREHSTEHDEISSGSESFSHIAGVSTTSVLQQQAF